MDQDSVIEEDPWLLLLASVLFASDMCIQEAAKRMLAGGKAAETGSWEGQPVRCERIRAGMERDFEHGMPAGRWVCSGGLSCPGRFGDLILPVICL